MTYTEKGTSQPIVLYFREWHPRTADLAERGSLLRRVVWSNCLRIISEILVAKEYKSGKSTVLALGMRNLTQTIFLVKRGCLQYFNTHSLEVRKFNALINLFVRRGGTAVHANFCARAWRLQLGEGA